jgi:hypothetical protein
MKIPYRPEVVPRDVEAELASASPNASGARVLAIAKEMEDRQAELAEAAAQQDNPGAFWRGALFAFAAKLREAVGPDPFAAPFPLSEGELRTIGRACMDAEQVAHGEDRQRISALLCRVLDVLNPEWSQRVDQLSREDEP